MTQEVIQLDKYRHLFLDDQAYQEFLLILRSKIGFDNEVLLLRDEEVVCMLLSPSEAAKHLRTSAITRLLKDPNPCPNL